MRMSNLRWSLVPLACVFLAPAWLCAGKAPAEGKGKEKAGRTERVTLQYRVARDAFAPSKFVAVSDGGISAPLELIWGLSRPEGNEKREAREKQKRQFDDLIRKLEEKQINGVEFECSGEWLENGFKLRVTSVPQLTEAGKRRIKEHER